jgi:hypothetical protein
VKCPSKELRGFERVALRPDQKKTVAFTLATEKLAFWDVKTQGFFVEPGAFGADAGLRKRRGAALPAAVQKRWLPRELHRAQVRWSAALCCVSGN